MKIVNDEIKLIALDVDGTLLNNKGHIDSLTKKMLHQVQKSGIIVTLCTGRLANWLDNLANKLKIDKFSQVVIGSNGSEIKNVVTNEFIYQVGFKNHEVCKIAEFLNRFNNIYYGLFLINDPYKIYWNSEEGVNWFNHKNTFSYLESKILSPNDNYDARQIILYANDKNIISEIESFFNSSFPEWSFTMSGYGVYIISYKNDNKWNGILKYSDYLHQTTGLKLSSNNIMTFGDELNDFEMIREAKYGIAMGNAAQDLKEVAFDVTSSNNDQGIAKAILKHIYGVS